MDIMVTIFNRLDRHICLCPEIKFWNFSSLPHIFPAQQRPITVFFHIESFAELLPIIRGWRGALRVEEGLLQLASRKTFDTTSLLGPTPETNVLNLSWLFERGWLPGYPGRQLEGL